MTSLGAEGIHSSNNGEFRWEFQKTEGSSHLWEDTLFLKRK